MRTTTTPSPGAAARRQRTVAGALSQLVVLLVVGAIVAMPAAHAAPAVGPQGWQWPVQPKPAVVRGFEPPMKKWLAGHRGVDLRAGSGTEIRAPADGTVSFVGVVVDRPVLTIAHAGGLRSSFEPVEATVSKGEDVRAGQIIGRLESGHCSQASCVHWGVRLGDEYVDPLALITDRRPSILLPLDGSG